MTAPTKRVDSTRVVELVEPTKPVDPAKVVELVETTGRSTR